uniref:Tetratricopeptide repeat protein n=1 Tax=Phenylobacterium glaciei TaxID=2803784 RepID=A0A974P657_9CAUL|nr:tetratricopeptide repeat protein [Phenylobacterium glaciei]
MAPTIVSPAEALIRQAGGWRRAGRNDQAEGALRRALAASPNNPDVLYALADLARSRETPCRRPCGRDGSAPPGPTTLACPVSRTCRRLGRLLR